MKRTNPFWVMAAVFLAACQQLDKAALNESEEHKEMNVSIVASIGKQNLERTTSSSNEGVFSFCSGDEMGIFTESGDLCKWQMTSFGEGEEWQSENPMKWPGETGTQMVTFYAYSPYVGEVSAKEITMPALSGQTGALNRLSSYDFLVARCSTTYQSAGGQVRFTGDNAFKHVSSLIAFTIKPENGMQGAQIQNVSFKAAGIATQAKCVFKDTDEVFAIEALPSAPIVNMLELTVNQEVGKEGMKIYAIINPLASDLAFSVTYQRNGISYTTKEATLHSDSDFLSNNMYTFSLSINKGDISIIGTDITPWHPNELGDITVDEMKNENVII